MRTTELKLEALLIHGKRYSVEDAIKAISPFDDSKTPGSAHPTSEIYILWEGNDVPKSGFDSTRVSLYGYKMWSAARSVQLSNGHIFIEAGSMSIVDGWPDGVERLLGAVTS